MEEEGGGVGALGGTARRTCFPEAVEQTRVELSTSRHNRLGRGLLFGRLVGAGIGGNIVAVNQASNELGEGVVMGVSQLVGEPPPPHHTVSQTLYAVGLVAGGVVGARIGGSIVVDTWQPSRRVPATSLQIAGDRAGVRLALSLSR